MLTYRLGIDSGIVCQIEGAPEADLPDGARLAV